jgi:hypothetical protein
VNVPFEKIKRRPGGEGWRIISRLAIGQKQEDFS